MPLPKDDLKSLSEYLLLLSAYCCLCFNAECTLAPKLSCLTCIDVLERHTHAYYFALAPSHHLLCFHNGTFVKDSAPFGEVGGGGTTQSTHSAVNCEDHLLSMYINRDMSRRSHLCTQLLADYKRTYTEDLPVRVRACISHNSITLSLVPERSVSTYILFHKAVDFYGGRQGHRFAFSIGISFESVSRVRALYKCL